VAVAAVLAAAWTLGLAVYARRLVRDYFPIADEWALLANSDTTLTSPLTWFTTGFSGYFEVDPSLSEPYANFLRPCVNLAYWVLGWFLSPTSPRRLVFNFAVIGACAGLTYVCASQRTHPRRHLAEAALAAAVPLLPAFLPSFIELTPYNAFDAMAAAICLLAYLAAERERHGLTVLLLIAAIFTKETALPMAAAVPVAFLFRNRSCLRSDRVALLQLVALTLPIVLWISARRLVFESVASGTYTWTEGVENTLAKMADLAPHWPVPSGGFDWRSPISVLLATINVTLIIGAISTLGIRLWQRARIDLAEVCWLFSYLFLLVVGVSARYGATFDVFLVVTVVRAVQRPVLRPASAMMVAGLVACAAWGGYFNWKIYPGAERMIVDYSRAAKRYVDELRRFGPDDTVVVLNDPVTWHARVKWLTAVAGIPATVVKAMDFSCPSSPERIRASCTVALRAADGRREFEFTQDCGLNFCGATVRPHRPVRRTLMDGVFVDLPQEQGSDDAHPVWYAMRLTLDRPNVFVVYFNPNTHSFERIHVP